MYRQIRKLVVGPDDKGELMMKMDERFTIKSLPVEVENKFAISSMGRNIIFCRCLLFEPPEPEEMSLHFFVPINELLLNNFSQSVRSARLLLGLFLSDDRNRQKRHKQTDTHTQRQRWPT